MIIISGPSTIGKNPLIYKLCQLYDLDYIVPSTTRAPRTEERNGVDYCFWEIDKFQEMIRNNRITFWDYCLDNYYGYTEFPVENNKAITHGLSRMAIRIKKAYPHSVKTVFLMPEDKEVVLARLAQIYRDNELSLRNSLVKEELIHSALFDYIYTIRDNSLELLNNSLFIADVLNEHKRNS